MTAAMSAHAAPAAGRPTLVIRGTPYPVLLPKLSDPRLHLAAVITSLQVLGQVEFHFRVSIAQILISLVTCAVLEVGDRVPPAARDPLAGERDAHGERRRVHPARARDAARRLVEHARLVDLLRHRRGVAPLEVRDRVARQPRLQPVEHRPRPLLPDPRPQPRRAARLLVGPDVVVARARAGDHRRRRPRDPLAPAAPRRSPSASGSRSRPGSGSSPRAGMRCPRAGISARSRASTSGRCS